MIAGDRVRVETFVRVPIADAFEVFTLEIDQWWRRGPAYRVGGKHPGTLHLEPAWMLPVAVMFALPLVRIFTAGGGLIPPVSWVGLGLAVGFLAYRRAQIRADAASGALTSAGRRT